MKEPNLRQVSASSCRSRKPCISTKRKGVPSAQKNVKDCEAQEAFFTINLKDAAKWSKRSAHDMIFLPKLKSQSGRNYSHPGAELESMWMAGFLHHANNTQEDLLIEESLDILPRLPSSAVVPATTNSIQQIAGSSYLSAKPVSLANDLNCELTKRERQRLDERQGLQLNKSSRPNQMTTLRSLYAPHQLANKKLSKKNLINKRTLQSRNEMRSERLDCLYRINRSEIQAAITLQSFWRRYLIVKNLKVIAFQHNRAIRIQAIYRGIRTRRWLVVWKKKRARAIVLCQSHLRRRVVARNWRRQVGFEHKMAVQCQLAIRFFLSKLNLHYKRQVRAANQIILAWQAWRAAIQSQRIELDQFIVLVQSQVRRWLSKKKFENMQTEKQGGASIIARFWRMYMARSIQSEALFKRDSEARANQIRLLKSEIQFQTAPTHLFDKVQFEDAFTKNATESKKKCEDERQTLESNLREHEADYLDLCCLRTGLSPRSVVQGWQEQTDKSIIDTRAMITKTKLDIIFRVYRGILNSSSGLQKQRDRLHCVSTKINQNKIWLEEEVQSLGQVQRREKNRVLQIRNKQKVADEKRLWKVDFRMPSGKPDKRKTSNLNKCNAQKISPIPRITLDLQKLDAATCTFFLGE